MRVKEFLVPRETKQGGLFSQLCQLSLLFNQSSEEKWRQKQLRKLWRVGYLWSGGITYVYLSLSEISWRKMRKAARSPLSSQQWLCTYLSNLIFPLSCPETNNASVKLGHLDAINYQHSIITIILRVFKLDKHVLISPEWSSENECPHLHI